ncbi:MAG: TatD family hydrolase [Tidjanibacter sp.]|nr:TatD family hydrolase [Tidjanibacter sp.]
MMLIDTHTHLYDEAFDNDRNEVFGRAREAGVGRFIFPAIDSQSDEALFSTCRQHPECLPLMGLHPTSVNDNPQWREELKRVETYLKKPPVDRFYGIGEVGLDLYWSEEWRREQTEVFDCQVELSLRYDLPLVIHTRSAWAEMIEILERYRGSGLRGVMHAFADTAESYQRVKSCGDFLFGIGGVVTYKKSTLPEVVRSIPLSDIVLETDSPYLPPVPFRGRRNESAFLSYICNAVAAIKEVQPDEVAAQTTINACRMFGIEP